MGRHREGTEQRQLPPSSQSAVGRTGRGPSSASCPRAHRPFTWARRRLLRFSVPQFPHLSNRKEGAGPWLHAWHRAPRLVNFGENSGDSLEPQRTQDGAGDGKALSPHQLGVPMSRNVPLLLLCRWGGPSVTQGNHTPLRTVRSGRGPSPTACSTSGPLYNPCLSSVGRAPPLHPEPPPVPLFSSDLRLSRSECTGTQWGPSQPAIRGPGRQLLPSPAAPDPRRGN